MCSQSHGHFENDEGNYNSYIRDSKPRDKEFYGAPMKNSSHACGRIVSLRSPSEPKRCHLHHNSIDPFLLLEVPKIGKQDIAL